MQRRGESERNGDGSDQEREGGGDGGERVRPDGGAPGDYFGSTIKIIN